MKYVLHFEGGGERLSVSFDLGARFFNDVVTIRANESDDSEIYVRFQDLNWLAYRLLNLASATEGESAVPKADAPSGDAQ
jgi:hypothetical protein